MPTIEVTAEQAAALARGENVTLTAPEPAPEKVKNKFLAATRGARYFIYSGEIHPGGRLRNVTYIRLTTIFGEPDGTEGFTENFSTLSRTVRFVEVDA